MAFSAVVGRVDVLAARQKQPVQPLENSAQRRLAHVQGDHHRQRAERLQDAHVGLIHDEKIEAEETLRLFSPHGDADQRTVNTGRPVDFFKVALVAQLTVHRNDSTFPEKPFAGIPPLYEAWKRTASCERSNAKIAFTQRRSILGRRSGFAVR